MTEPISAADEKPQADGHDAPLDGENAPPIVNDVADPRGAAWRSVEEAVAKAEDPSAAQVAANDDEALSSVDVAVNGDDLTGNDDASDIDEGVEARLVQASAKVKAKAAAPPSEDTAQVIDWVRASRDNGDLPFMVIDKAQARLLVFGADGDLVSSTAVLLGITKGDDSTPGIGNRELFTIPRKDRTTPAGRFVARFGPAAGGHGRVLWVDYGDSIALHPVVTSNPKEQRVQRLRSATPRDNRITYGCINVPASFYTKVVSPLFAHGGGVVYVLPDKKPLTDVFPSVAIGLGSGPKLSL